MARRPYHYADERRREACYSYLYACNTRANGARYTHTEYGGSYRDGGKREREREREREVEGGIINHSARRVKFDAVAD